MTLVFKCPPIKAAEHFVTAVFIYALEDVFENVHERTLSP